MEEEEEARSEVEVPESRVQRTTRRKGTRVGRDMLTSSRNVPREGRTRETWILDESIRSKTETRWYSPSSDG